MKNNNIVTKSGNLMGDSMIVNGDQLDIREKDGVIYMMPVTVYPKGYIDSLRSELTQLKEDIQYGKQPVFTSIDALMEKLEET